MVHRNRPSTQKITNGNQLLHTLNQNSWIVSLQLIRNHQPRSYPHVTVVMRGCGDVLGEDIAHPDSPLPIAIIDTPQSQSRRKWNIIAT